jgi:hypothetical protein
MKLDEYPLTIQPTHHHQPGCGTTVWCRTIWAEFGSRAKRSHNTCYFSKDLRVPRQAESQVSTGRIRIPGRHADPAGEIQAGPGTNLPANDYWL